MSYCYSICFHFHCQFSAQISIFWVIFIFFYFSQFSCGFAGSSEIVESTYDFSVTDSNSLLFLFKHSPEVAEKLNITSEFSFESASLSKRQDWMVSVTSILSERRLLHLFQCLTGCPLNNEIQGCVCLSPS